MSNTHPNRETWLQAAIDLARPDFEAAGNPVPEKVRVSIGNRFGKNVLGLCYGGSSSADGVREMFLSPYIEDVMVLVATLVHEVAHASLPEEAKHKKPFEVLVRKLHLEGKPTHTTAGDEFKAVWEPRLEALGPYPGAVMVPEQKEKRPASHITMQCPDCSFKFYSTPKMLEAARGDFRCIDAGCDGQPIPVS